MSIFKRKTGEQDRSQFEFEDSFAKPERKANMNAPVPPMHQRPNMQPPQQPMASTAAAQGARPPKRRAGYSIEDAIVLMRELPSDQRDMVVSIVQKTLSSANISVEDIMDDAARKLNRLGTRKAQLNQEISELEAGIKERQEEIEKITSDAEETEAVKISFEAAHGNPRVQNHRYDDRQQNLRDTDEHNSQNPVRNPNGVPSNNAS